LQVVKKQWFGATVAAVTNNSPSINTEDFPHNLRLAIEPHILKCRIKREKALQAIKMSSGVGIFDTTMEEFNRVDLSNIRIKFDSEDYPLRKALTDLIGLQENFDLSTLHMIPRAKIQLMYSLTRNFETFQRIYDEFVRGVCIPQIEGLFACESFYYQSFPCLRIVQPHEFSIGPHADVSYGHHPCSVNFYTLLTKTGGTATLFLESQMGREDWQPITEKQADVVKAFAGAVCAHWTTENKTDYTRVSFDFRVIPSSMFHNLQCGGNIQGGQIDVYRRSPGYYCKCTRTHSINGAKWSRIGPLPEPDSRVGYPWTVKSWNKYLSQVYGSSK